MGQVNPWNMINDFATQSVNSEYSTVEADVSDYVELQREANEIDSKKKLLKDKIVGQLGSDSEPGTVWNYAGARVEMCKGRVTKKLNRKVLVLCGVSKDVLDNATQVIEGKPSLRITVERGNDAT